MNQMRILGRTQHNPYTYIQQNTIIAHPVSRLQLIIAETYISVAFYIYQYKIHDINLLVCFV